MDEDGDEIHEAAQPEGAADWLDIDVFGNALDNIEKTAMFLSNSKDSYRWKWATTALTNALYGFMICPCAG